MQNIDQLYANLLLRIKLRDTAHFDRFSHITRLEQS
jgi:hypothetical protein